MKAVPEKGGGHDEQGLCGRCISCKEYGGGKQLQEQEDDEPDLPPGSAEGCCEDSRQKGYRVPGCQAHLQPYEPIKDEGQAETRNHAGKGGFYIVADRSWLTVIGQKSSLPCLSCGLEGNDYERAVRRKHFPVAHEGNSLSATRWPRRYTSRC